MSVPEMTNKHVALFTIAIIGAVGIAYFVFLYATWNQFQLDRATRDEKINELLDRLPPKGVKDVKSSES